MGINVLGMEHRARWQSRRLGLGFVLQYITISDHIRVTNPVKCDNKFMVQRQLQTVKTAVRGTHQTSPASPSTYNNHHTVPFRITRSYENRWRTIGSSPRPPSQESALYTMHFDDTCTAMARPLKVGVQPPFMTEDQTPNTQRHQIMTGRPL